MSIPPTPVEIRLIDAIFSVEDPQRSGFISRGRRIEVFGGSRLPLNILENIWTLIELGNDGFLTRNDTAIALRLIGWAQAGRSPSRELAEKPGPAAILEGVHAAPSQLPSLPSTEVGLINAIINIADPHKLGLVTGEQGVKVFAGSKLPPAMLGDIWALADPENNGVLTRKGVAVTVRLIGWAQAGETPSEELIEKPGPLAVIEGVAASAPVTSIPRQATPTATLSTPLPPLTSADRAKFLNAYNRANPVNGLVSGDSAMNTFMRSKLPIRRLNAIWNLVDTTDRDALDAVQFVLAMYFIQGSMSSNPTIPVLPPSIPPSLWEQAGGRLPSVYTQTTGESLPSLKLSGPGSGLAGIGIPRAFSPQYTGGSGTSHQPGSTAASQFTGISAQPTSSRILPSAPTRPRSNFSIAPQPTGQPFPLARVPQQLPWDITAEEMAKSDGFFESLDTGSTGYIDGDAAGSFMLNSGLSEDILAKVWDLADMSNKGRLDRNTFAVAMHLINGVLEGKDLPSSLPPTLVPPSMRPPASSFPSVIYSSTPFGSSHEQPQSARPQMTQPFFSI